MNISFDLDGTLIPFNKEFETEKRSLLAKLFGIERLRKGSSVLIADLQREGHKIHVYTTSFRSKIKIRIMLKYYGVSVNKIINQTRNRKVLKSLNLNLSKYPPAFGFDLHIDDLKGVEIEGAKFNFKVVVVSSSDINWVLKIKKSLTSVKNL
ncbi:HAD family hydrolase [Tenacibaculum sp. M341]|uniref:HAD family hydrolase n=1 Tax=Tenacibaculum sp. M341 TaxID=2530339 RepID=UPI001046E62B|nr:HAD family hydrolase [Tenacibaculum sp. M341]TCI85008.1 HAD family hydrolase [Tenacibaculum sp. M341]